MKLTIVGCAGSFPGPESAASSYLVQSDDTSILLDLGSGAFGPLQQHVSPTQLGAVFISHLHIDHYADLGSLFVCLNYGEAKPDKRVKVYGPAGIAARIAAGYGDDGDTARLDDVLEFIEYEPGQQIEVGSLTVTPFAVDHWVDSCGFRVEDTIGRVLAYSADTGMCDGLVNGLKGAEVALVEASLTQRQSCEESKHLTGRQAAQAAQLAGVDRLLLTHLVAWNDPAEIEADARGVWDRDLSIAAAGMTVTI